MMIGGRAAAHRRHAEYRDEFASLARGGAANLLGAALSALANVGLVATVARGFSKVEAGAFFSAVSVFLILVAATRLGTDTGLVYFIARCRALGAPERVSFYLRAAFPPVAAMATTVGAALFLLAPLLAGALLREEAGHLVTHVRTLAVFLPLGVLFEVTTAATRGFRNMAATVTLDRIGRPLAQLTLVLTAVAVGDARLLGVAWAAPYLPGLLICWLWLVALRRRSAAEAVPGKAVAGSAQFWAYTLPRMFAGVAQMLMQRIDIVLVATLVGPAAAAVYTAATRFLVFGQLVAQAIGRVVQPRLGEFLALADREATNAIYQTTTAWLVIFAWPIYALCAVLAPWILRIFGEGYTRGALVIVVLALAMLVATACGTVDMVLAMAGKTTWNLANVLAALVVNIGLDLLLIPWYGILGAAVAWAAAILVANLLPLAQVASKLRLHPFSTASLGAGALAMLCFGTVPLVGRLAGDGRDMPLVAAILIGALAYAYGCWRWRESLRLRALWALAPSLARG